MKVCSVGLVLGLATLGVAAPFEWSQGNIRVQVLDEDLLRIEEKGPGGFDDRLTFNVVERDWPGARVVVRKDGDAVLLIAPKFRVRVTNTDSAKGLDVQSLVGKSIYRFDGNVPQHSYLPSPANVPPAWVLPDAPRLFRNRERLFPVQADQKPFDASNPAVDLYVFVPGQGGYAALRKDLLRLTGPIPMPPMYMFGFIDSRYHEYSEKTALETIDRYKSLKLPLDVFVVDTDWRVGASHGYATNKTLFPDMARFIKAAHDRKIRLMYNDHPEPVDRDAQGAKELQYRFDGLASLLTIGMDVWWYDRNWGTHIGTPAQGLPLEVWGMHVYEEATRNVRPEARPVVMSNVWGIDNGNRNGRVQHAAHRYPVWWTGDTVAQWDFLEKGVVNGVDFGVLALQPYVNEDLGGHGGAPSNELYVRFLQFGCLSPVTRVHCTKGQTRYPWDYGKEAEAIVRDYSTLRYRLMPTLYSASRRAFEDGTPVLRRCDLEWPQYKEAADPTQYLFGDDILVAPIIASKDKDEKPIASRLLTHDGGKPGLLGEYFNTVRPEGTVAAKRVDSQVAFDWQKNSPAEGVQPSNYSVRWTGMVGPAPESGPIEFSTFSDDGVRLWVDGKLVIDKWIPQAGVRHAAKVQLRKGQVVPIRLEFYNGSNEGVCKLSWTLPSEQRTESQRTVWIPPGQWEDLWTGRVVDGPKAVRVSSPLWHTPMYVRRSGMVVTAPQVLNTQDLKGDRFIVDAFPRTKSVQRTVYQDDGYTQSYLNGAFAKTTLDLASKTTSTTVSIGRAEGGYTGLPSSRVWTVRLHLAKGSVPGRVSVDGKTVASRVVRPKPGNRMPFLGIGSAPASGSGPVVEVDVRLPSNRKAVVSFSHAR